LSFRTCAPFGQEPFGAVRHEENVLRPSPERFAELATEGNLVPVVREIMADLDTPLSIFRRLDDGRTSFLLESVEGGEKWARYSFIGTGARAIFRARGSAVEWDEGGECQREEVAGDPLDFLRAKLATLDPVYPEDLELPRFVGGAVGMISYDWVRFVERIPDDNPDNIGLPDLWFVLPETVVVYDNISHKALIVRHVHLEPGDDPAVGYRAAVQAIDATVRQLRGALPAQPGPEPVTVPMDVERSMSEQGFHEIVKRAKEYIEAGDIFQVVLAQQFQMPLQVDPFSIYRYLRSINPSPYLFFIRMEEGAVLVGSSPEILVRVEGDRVDVRPIAGTRRRGETSEEDDALEADLLADPKERAEHVMLVDLGRNDIGRVAEVGSVNVNEYAIVERYSHVMHIVSNVQGKLRAGLDWLDVLRATFPAGTLSGAPKVRAMEIIDELETVRRGPYGGCAGYIDYSGNMDMAITIRTMVVNDGTITLQSGAGVVADSTPEYEFEETINKARAVLQAIDLAREGID
jgi:anthranilate synthase component 1